jgi:hypothetical protein
MQIQIDTFAAIKAIAHGPMIECKATKAIAEGPMIKYKCKSR